MSVSIPSFARRPHTSTARILADRRRHKRIHITLLGRFMRENRHEYPCKLTDISVGGASLMSPTEVEVGERIIAYFDQIGGIEGAVVRPFEGGFGMRLAITQHKREKLAAQLTWFINREILEPTDERRHERIVPENTHSQLKLAEGIVIEVQVLDISISGASVATSARPPLGQEITLSRLRAKVVRHHDYGIGVQFIDIQNPAALRRYFG